MSRELIARSPDLLRLLREGYDLEIRSGFLVINDVPYVNQKGEVRRGLLVSTLTIAGDSTTRPDTHVVTFGGEMPCRRDGRPLTDKLGDNHQHQQLAEGLTVNYAFSSKPAEGYPDYHAKMTTYIDILGGEARAIEPTSTARTFRTVEPSEEESVFKYLDTATARAGIGVAASRMAGKRIGIVGLGGSGAYILDLIAKTPVAEIHLFDGDVLLTHNAFRAPGAPRLEELRESPLKVEHYTAVYSRMRRGIVPHPYFIDEKNVHELATMDFVFISMEDAAAKAATIECLEKDGVAFIDVGMGISEADGALSGILRVTTSTADHRDHVHSKHRIPLANPDAGDNEYERNIQVADLNCLNAALAVVRWKRLCGFYVDVDGEYHSVFMIDGNLLINEDR
jgi:hypothetical protein